MKKFKTILGYTMATIGFVIVWFSSPLWLQGLLFMVGGIGWILDN